MRLLIISGMPHYVREGQIVGWGPTAQEISHLAELFEEIRHVAPLHTDPAPALALPYGSDRITFVRVPPAGGKKLPDKLKILAVYPDYLRTILKELRKADVVHVRCPDNISLLAIVALMFVCRPRVRWVKYAGNWRPGQFESWSYAFQRWWLERGLHRGLVTVNGHWPNQPRHVSSFINPCFTDEELDEARSAAQSKPLSSPLRLIYVGRLETEKGVGRALQILSKLRQAGREVTLDLIGDGPERVRFEEQAAALGLGQTARFHGWLAPTALRPLYARSHIMLFPTSASEGWPKVLSEAMAYGVVPIAGNVSCIGQFLDSFMTGRVVEPENLDEFCQTVGRYIADPALWKEHSCNAIAGAASFTYSCYLKAVRNLLKMTSDQRAGVSSALSCRKDEFQSGVLP